MNQAGSTKQCASSHSATWLVTRLFWTVVVTAAILVSTGTAVAQSTTGVLRGQVLDPSGAAVSGCQVTVTNESTGVSQTITTTSAGTYTLPRVLPGSYTVAAESKGFKKYLAKDVPV